MFGFVNRLADTLARHLPFSIQKWFVGRKMCHQGFSQAYVDVVMRRYNKETAK